MNEAAAAIALHTDDVARRAVQLLLEGAPRYATSLDEGGRRLCEEDAGLHVRALVGSVAAGDPRIVADYTSWAAGLANNPGVTADHLAELLRATAGAIAELVPSAVGAVQPHLEAGERALAR